MSGGTLGYQEEFCEFAKKHFSVVYHKNFHSLTRRFHLIGNVEERVNGKP